MSTKSRGLVHAFAKAQWMKNMRLKFSVDAARRDKDSTGPDKNNSPLGPPSPPPEGLCCMTGCQKCVWLVYAEELLNYHKDGGKLAEKALDNVPDENLKAFLKMEFKMKK
eukprot:gene9063-10031_t